MNSMPLSRKAIACHNEERSTCHMYHGLSRSIMTHELMNINKQSLATDFAKKTLKSEVFHSLSLDHNFGYNSHAAYLRI